MQAHNSLITFEEDRKLTRQLALPLLVSLLLHLVILSQIDFNHMHSPKTGLSPLTVRLSPPKQTAIPKASPVHRSAQHAEPQAASTFSALPSAPLPEPLAETTNIESNAYDTHLDMNRIYAQARTYTRQALATARPEAPVYGDYFGTYGGGDSGTFYVHLDADGRASGSGRSDTRGIAFHIQGKVLPSGEIQMAGVTNVGATTFTGYLTGSLDKRTRTLHGTWSVRAGLVLNGSFSGQRELQLSLN